MGCWNETCEITQLPIAYNERCVMIDFSRALDPDQIHDKFEGPEILRIVKGSYSDYGDLKEYPDSEYPGIEKLPSRMDYCMRPKFIRSDGVIPVYWRSFIKESVWDAIVQKYPEPTIWYRSERDVLVSTAINNFLAERKRANNLSEETKDDAIFKFTTQMRLDSLQRDTFDRAGIPIHLDLELAIEFVKIYKFMHFCRIEFNALRTSSQEYGLDEQSFRIKLLKQEHKKLCEDTL